MLAGLAGRTTQDSGPVALPSHQDLAAGRDVVELEAARHPGDDADLSVQGDRVERLVGARVGRGEPDLVSGRRPRQAVLPRPLVRQGLLVPREVDDRDRSRVVQREGMVEKRDPVSLRREPRAADVAGGLVEHLAHRVLDARLALDVAGHEHRGAVLGPVGVLDSLGDVPGRAAGQRGARELPGADSGMARAAVHGDRHLAGGRDAQQVGARKLEGQRIGARGMLEEQLRRAAVPGRGVDDRLPVGRESGRANRAAAEADLLVGGRRRSDASLREHSEPERRDDQGGDGDPASGRDLFGRTAATAGPGSRSRPTRSPRRGARGRSGRRAPGRASRRSAPRGPSGGSAR